MEQTSTSDNSREKSEKNSEKALSPQKINMLKKKLKVMRTALKDENTTRLTVEKEL